MVLSHFTGNVCCETFPECCRRLLDQLKCAYFPNEIIINIAKITWGINIAQTRMKQWIFEVIKNVSQKWWKFWTFDDSNYSVPGSGPSGRSRGVHGWVGIKWKSFPWILGFKSRWFNRWLKPGWSNSFFWWPDCQQKCRPVTNWFVTKWIVSYRIHIWHQFFAIECFKN